MNTRSNGSVPSAIEPVERLRRRPDEHVHDVADARRVERVARRRAACAGSISSVVSAAVRRQRAREPEGAVPAERADLEDPPRADRLREQVQELALVRRDGDVRQPGRPRPRAASRPGRRPRARAPRSSRRPPSRGRSGVRGAGNAAAVVDRPRACRASVAATSTSQSVRSVPSAPAAGVAVDRGAARAPRRPRRPSRRRRRRPTPRGRRGSRRTSARRARGGGLGEPCTPTVATAGDVERLVAREQRRDVAVGTHAEQQRRRTPGEPRRRREPRARAYAAADASGVGDVVAERGHRVHVLGRQRSPSASMQRLAGLGLVAVRRRRRAGTARRPTTGARRTSRPRPAPGSPRPPRASRCRPCRR